MIIRDELPSDLPSIRKVVQAAFARPLEADLVDQLRTDGDIGISLVAFDGHRTLPMRRPTQTVIAA